MALKEVRTHQRNKQPVSLSCKQSASKKKEPLQDPWSFLELIDAPQWCDLSLEASLIDTEWQDPWFDTVHRHHAISLADKNVPVKGHLFCKAKSQVKVTKLKPKRCVQGFKKTDRSSNVRTNHSRLPEIQNTSNTFSGSSGISENEQCSTIENQRSRYERLSVTSTFRAACLESRKLSTESALSSLTEDTSGTPRDHSTRVRSESVHPVRPKLRFSFELCNSNLIKQQRDRQSSGVSGLTSTSTASCSSDEQCDMPCSRKSEVCSELRTVNEGFSDHEDSGRAINIPTKHAIHSQQTIVGTANYNHNRSETVRKDLKMVKKPSTGRQQAVAKSDALKRDRNSQIHQCQVGPYSRKQECKGKENENPSTGGILKDLQKMQLVKLQSSFTAHSRKSSKMKSVAPPVVQKNSCAVARVPLTHHVPGSTNERKSMINTADKHLGDKSNNSENDLADLVAKHNQKIRMLQMHQQRKGFR